MTVTTSLSPDKSQVTIKISGRFDFSLVQDFRNAYRDKDPGANFTVDLANTNYLDSSALGMLIHLWKFAGQDKTRVKIINSNPDIKKVFDITHFNRNFTIL